MNAVDQLSETAAELEEQEIRARVDVALKSHFRPEFLNRIDDIIVFHRLGKDTLARIVDIEIDKLLKDVLMETYCTTLSSYSTITGFASMRNGKIRASCSAVVNTGATQADAVIQWREGPNS